MSSDTIELPLSKGYVAVIDAADAHLAQYKWSLRRHHGKLYATRRDWASGQNIKLHHAVSGKPAPGLVVDHEDGDGLNNRRANLVEKTDASNKRNLSADPMKGIRFEAGKWRARIGGRHIGRFPTANDAIAARLAAEKAAWGIQPRRATLHGDA